MMNMPNNMISDDMLETVNGGTAAETDELVSLLGVDKYSLNDALKDYGVTGTALLSANNMSNMYVLADGSTITHEKLIELIKSRKG